MNKVTLTRELHIIDVAEPRHCKKHSRPITRRTPMDPSTYVEVGAQGWGKLLGTCSNGDREYEPRNWEPPGLIGCTYQTRCSSEHVLRSKPARLWDDSTYDEMSEAVESGEASSVTLIAREPPGRRYQHPKIRERPARRLPATSKGIAEMLAYGSRRTLPEATQRGEEGWSRTCPGARVSRTWG